MPAYSFQAVNDVASKGESALARLFLEAECVTTAAKGLRVRDHIFLSFFDGGQW